MNETYEKFIFNKITHPWTKLRTDQQLCLIIYHIVVVIPFNLFASL